MRSRDRTGRFPCIRRRPDVDRAAEVAGGGAGPPDRRAADHQPLLQRAAGRDDLAKQPHHLGIGQRPFVDCSGGAGATPPRAPDDQRLVPSPPHHTSRVEDEDLVGIDDRRQPVGDAERRAPARQLAQVVLDLALGGGVRVADVASSRTRIGGFFSTVRAIATRCFSPPESFSPRSPTTVRYPSGVETMKSWMRASRAARSTSAGRRVRPPVGDVVVDVFVEQHRVLGNDADRRAQARLGDRAHVLPVDPHRPAVRLVEAAQQPAHRGLPGRRRGRRWRGCARPGSRSSRRGRIGRRAS